MHFVFVHGWGFHAGIWRALLHELRGTDMSLVDLGFIDGGPEGVSGWPEDALAIGHSLGVLWLLQRAGKQERRPFRGLVSIQGFDCFNCHVPQSRVAGMRRELKRDADATLQAFWRASGTEAFAPADALNVERLDAGLSWLMDWDARAVRSELGCPVLALAARDDTIVPEAMSASIWGNDKIQWAQDGGHVLPLIHPEWCARHVLNFAHALQS